MIPFAANAAATLQRAFTQNGISIGLAVIAQLSFEYRITLQWAATFSKKLPLPLDFYGPPESSSQTASRSVQPFMYGSQML